MKRAFTLIELLVVVLIIGILAAIALPQYQAAVDKTKVVGALQLARSIKTAEEAYYLANGTYTNKQEELDLGFSTNTGSSFSSKGFSFTLQEQTPGTPWSVYAREHKIGVLLIVSYDKGVWKGKSACYAISTSDRGKKVCRSLTGKSKQDATQTNYWVYYFN